MQLLFFAEEMEEERRVHGGYPSVKRVERCQTAQIWRGAHRRVGGREGRHNLEVHRVEGVTRDECYRVRLRRRPEEFMPEVREFCEVRAMRLLAMSPSSAKSDLGVNRM